MEEKATVEGQMTACRHGRSQCPDPLELGKARPDEIPVDPEHSAQSGGGWKIP
jgi:hypothetical protein